MSNDDKIAQFPTKAPKPPATDLYDLAPFSEEALALTFADRYADQLRYVHDWGKWLTRAETIWRLDTASSIFTRARKTCRDMAIASDAPRTASAIATAKTVAAVVALARLIASMPQPLRPVGRGSRCCSIHRRGMINLANGRLEPHRSEATITRKVTAAAPGTLPCPLWLKFLDRIFDRTSN